MTSMVLRTEGLGKSFGAISAVRDVNFSIVRGARHALIGPNGAGKTTFINLLTGVFRASTGKVFLKDQDVTGAAQARRIKMGIARTFQINKLFRGLSVLENVYMAVSERTGASNSIVVPAGLRSDVIDESQSILKLLKLDAHADMRIDQLPYGRQRLVEIAISLGLKSDVLLLDEPMAGVPSSETHIILDAIAALPKDTSVLIIEHDMDVVFRFAERISVLVRGAIIAEGTPAEIMENAEVRSVYLGEDRR